MIEIDLPTAVANAVVFALCTFLVAFILACITVLGSVFFEWLQELWRKL